jgi:hypothetical protein
LCFHELQIHHTIPYSLLPATAVPFITD